MDESLALDLWDLMIEVSRTTETNLNPATKATRKLQPSTRKLGVVPTSNTKSQHVTRSQKVDQLRQVDHVRTNSRISQAESQLYIFEDKEAVIKMTIKGRSSTMRHVLRTHRVALDWLFDRMNLEPKIQIKYIDTKNQLADILTKGSFSRDEWSHFLCLLRSLGSQV